jgi:hypothetical protein
MKEVGHRGRNRENRETKIRVEGILAASEWDGDGTVTRVRLLTTDEEEYAIENGESFLNLARKYVRVSGALRPSRTGGPTLRVRKITVLDPPFGEGAIAAKPAA